MKKKIISLLSLFILLFTSFISVSPFVVNANDIYTTIYEDLSNDENFTIDNYPVVKDKYELDIIEIAESSDKDLFIYVYNPSLELQTKKVALSTDSVTNPSFKIYDLEIIDYYSTIEKYRVKEFSASTDNVRYYSISQIYRLFNTKIDTNKDKENVNYIIHAIKDKWTFNTNSDGTLTVDKTNIDVITITDKFTSYKRYDEGFFLDYEACDSHFIAFNTDKNIEDLKSAVIKYSVQEKYYEGHLSGVFLGNFDNGLLSPIFNTWALVPSKEKRMQDYHTLLPIDKEEIGKLEDKHIELKDTDVYTGGSKLFVEDYSYSRIQKVEEFLEKENGKNTFKEEYYNNIKNKKWVLRFAETDYVYDEWINILKGNPLTKYEYESYLWSEKFTEVTEVAILQLSFETDGVTYQLPVIDNLESGTKDPVNNDWGTPDLDLDLDLFGDDNSKIELIKKIISVVLTILILLIIIRIIRIIIKPYKKRKSRI